MKRFVHYLRKNKEANCSTPPAAIFCKPEKWSFQLLLSASVFCSFGMALFLTTDLTQTVALIVAIVLT
jgi:hypothetical protein